MSPLTLVVFITTFLLVLLASLAFTRNGKKRAFKLPPGKKGWPLLGETLLFLKHHPVTSVGPFIGGHTSRYGKIFMSSLFGERTVVSTDAELNRFILQNDLKLFGPGWPKTFQHIMGEYSAAVQIGDAHKYMRSVIVNFLSNTKLRTVFLGDVERLAIMRLSSWRENSVISVTNEAVKFTFNIMAKNLLSMDPGPETEEMRREFKAFQKGFISLPLNFPRTAYRKALQSRANILGIIKKKTEERIQKRQYGTEVTENNDFLGWLIENTNYSSQQIGDLLLNMLFAGHDTTAKAIPLAVYFLEGCPKAIKQLREEHLKIVRAKRHNDSRLTWDDYKQMEFTQCVINESLRLGNIVQILQKKASTNVQYNGYDIPCGCNVTLMIPGVHLDPTNFEDPEHFDPWRWMVLPGIKKNNNFMAFGGGTRICPGSELARLELAMFLHHLILNYNWQMAEPDHPLAIPSVYFPKGLPIKISVASGNSL